MLKYRAITHFSSSAEEYPDRMVRGRRWAFMTTN
jgi:hypothetical protein